MNQYIEQLIFLILTYLFYPLFSLISFFKKSNQKKILIVQTAKIGDLVCSTPVFREIKRKYPESYLAVICLGMASSVLENNPHIDEIILADNFIKGGFFKKLAFISKIREKKFDTCFTLLPDLLGILVSLWSPIPKRVMTTSRYTSKTNRMLSLLFKDRLEYKRHTLTATHYLKLLEFINIKETDKKKELFFSQEDEKKVDSFLRENDLVGKNLIGTAVTAGNVLKEWPLEKFAQLFDKLINDLGVEIIVFGSEKDKGKINHLESMMKNRIFNLAGLFTLPQSSAFLSKMKVFVSVDTGPLYMANAVGIPVVDIAGPIDINEQPPLGENCIIVQKKIECLPCSFVLPPARVCRNPEKLKCLKLITVDDVFKAVFNLYNE